MQPDDLIEKNFRLTLPQKRALKKLGLITLEGLLRHFPSHHVSQAQTRKISDLKTGEKVTIYAKVTKNEIKKAYRKKIPIAEMTLEDDTGKIKAVWFHQAYMAKKIPEGQFAEVSGTVNERKGTIYLANPALEETTGIPKSAGDTLFSEEKISKSFIPTYPESRGISSLWFLYAIQKLIRGDVLEKLEDPIPEEILKRYSLPSLQTALVWIHAPQNQNDALAASKRFAFEEIFFIQVDRQKHRQEYKANPAFQIKISEDEISEFIERFPFKPTGAQNKAIKNILDDLKKDAPMTRLLEGDVGSGKTAVAAATVYGVTITHPDNKDFGNLQTAYMVPTEILARQHFQSFIELFSHMPINIGLITSSECRKFPSKVDPTDSTHISRSQLLKWVANGEIPILIGTHSLIQKSVQFKHLAYVIVDEQHRFGTMQRSKLTKKGGGEIMTPHLLSMTATPIPRTLALTIYGDLDLTLLDQMPAGRKPIITEIVLPNKREQVYEKIRQELKAGRQAYVICPRIDEPDPTKKLALNVKSAKAEAKRLQEEVFPEFGVGLVHSKLKPKDKEAVMNDFIEGKINILTATSVIEVGVNVPNATMIIIEGAERFGLAQLHQLRGRVLRSTHQAFCYLFSDSKVKTATDRLKALRDAENGFALAEEDLKLRGPGALAGIKQWGVTDIGMEAIKNIKMVEAARVEAQKLLEKDSDFKKHPLIKNRLEKNEGQIHLE